MYPLYLPLSDFKQNSKNDIAFTRTVFESFIDLLTAQKKIFLSQIQPDSNYLTYKNNQLNWIGETKDQVLGLDFCSNKQIQRHRHINKAQEPILRAIGWKANMRLNVLDVTAGLGRDSAMMAASGCNVTMIERNEILQILLEYALLQISQHDSESQKNIHTALNLPLTLVKDDAIQYLHRIESLDAPSMTMNYDVIYMDPMFPQRQKSALVKLDLRMIKCLVGDDPDADQLLNNAINSGIKRIVVKRPKHAPYIADIKPHHEIYSPNMRFDVYQNLNFYST